MNPLTEIKAATLYAATTAVILHRRGEIPLDELAAVEAAHTAVSRAHASLELRRVRRGAVEQTETSFDFSNTTPMPADRKRRPR